MTASLSPLSGIASESSIGGLVGRSKSVLVSGADADLIAQLSVSNSVTTAHIEPDSLPELGQVRFDVVIALDQPLDAEGIRSVGWWLDRHLNDAGYALLCLQERPGDTRPAAALAASRLTGVALGSMDSRGGRGSCELALVHRPPWEIDSGVERAATSGSAEEIAELRSMLRRTHLLLAERDSLISALVVVRGRGRALAQRLITARSSRAGRLMWPVAIRARRALRTLRDRRQTG
jgi:hypothetical protein